MEFLIALSFPAWIFPLVMVKQGRIHVSFSRHLRVLRSLPYYFSKSKSFAAFLTCSRLACVFCCKKTCRRISSESLIASLGKPFEYANISAVASWVNGNSDLFPDAILHRNFNISSKSRGDMGLMAMGIMREGSSLYRFTLS